MQLPPRNSVQDKVLQEMIHRERAVEFHKTAYVGRVLGLAFGVEGAKLARAESLLAASIFQTAYDPKSMRLQLARMASQLKEAHSQRVDDARILAKTASYSDDVDEIEQVAATFTENVLGRKIVRG